MVGGRKEVLKLFDTEDSGQLLVGWPWRQIELHRSPTQGVDIEKADGAATTLHELQESCLSVSK
jgi:hypothetical protein